MKVSLKSLLKNYKLKNDELYEAAFTHTTYANEKNIESSYERLELLGDAVIQLVITKYLYNKFQFKDEGELTKIRENFVKGETQLELAEKLNLINYCFLGNGVKKDDEKNKIKKELLETFVGAIFLIEGFNKSEDFLKKTLIKYGEEQKLYSRITDYKTALQERLQLKKAKKQPKIEYLLTSEKKGIFNVELRVDGIKKGFGSGNSKIEAEKKAAKTAFLKIFKK